MTLPIQPVEGPSALQDDAAPAPGSPADYEVSLQSLSQWELAWRKFKQHRLALIGLGIMAALILSAIIGPIFLPYAFDNIPKVDQNVYGGRPPLCAVYDN